MLDQVPVVYADQLSEDDVKALRLADNKTNESPWDFGKLEEELAGLSIVGLDMVQFGFENFDEAVLDDLFEPAEEKEKEPKKVQCPHCGKWFTP